MLRTTSRGVWVGAAAGVITAAGDLVGSWRATTDHASLAIALIGLLAGSGALLGGLLAAFGAAFARGSGRGQWPFVLLASPALAAVAWLSFSGGSASRVPFRFAWIALAFVALVSILYVALYVARALIERAHALRGRRGDRGRDDRALDTEARVTAGRRDVALVSLAVLGSVVVHVLLTVADHWVLPGLYDHLHAVATASRWLTAGLAIVLVLALVGPSTPALRGLGLRPRALAAIVLLGVSVVGVVTTGTQQTVRVAMFSPRAPAARSLMLAIAPALTLAERPATPSRARTARREVVDGPATGGAHLLLITIDALRADHLGHYGYTRRPTSPALDRLAADSVVFERAYAQVPHSSYSLSSLMTADYLYQRAGLDQPLPEATLASALASVGYHTAAFYTQGVFHTEGPRLAPYRDGGFGFESRSHVDVGGAAAKTDAALAELDAVARAGEQPMFLWVHYFDVHEPYEDTRFGTRDIERYDSEIRRVDAEVDRLIREARARLRRPVVVAITADHGEEFRDHGGVYHGSSVYDEQVRVPLLVSAPGVTPRRVASPVELVHVAPTLLGLLDVAAPPSMRGEDLRPLMASDPAEPRVAFASAGTRHMVLRWPYKLICDLRFGTRELYDLSRDPRERTNLADDEPARVDALRAEIQSWLDGLADDEVDPHELALYRGRLHDRRAITGLAALLRDPRVDADERAEAARLLGRLPHETSRAALAASLNASHEIGANAAIALGRLGDRRAIRRLRALIDAEEEEYLARASLALAYLGESRAVPGLLGVIGEGAATDVRVEAIHLLGRLRDDRAVEPLIALLDDPQVGRRAAIALGRIGHPDARGPLIARLERTNHAEVREAIARALGQIGDAADGALLVRLATVDEAPSAIESLVRIGAVGSLIGGVDVGPELRRTFGVEGLRACRARSDFDAWSYLGRTTCQTRGARVVLPLAAPTSSTASGWTVVLRARRADGGPPTQVRVTLGASGERSTPVSVDSEWREHRWRAPSGSLDHATLELDDPGARVELDHLLLLPDAPAGGSG